MFLHDTERTLVLIDGSNLYAAARNLGFEIDFKLLLEWFQGKTTLVRAAYYSAVLETEDYSPLKPLCDWLSYNGYLVVTKAAKEFTDTSGRRRIKGNMEVEIAVDMLLLAPRVDHIVLIAGDSDFRAAVEAVQRQGVKVTAVSSIKTAPPVIGDELRRQVDSFVELADIAPEVGRKLQNGGKAKPTSTT